MKLKITKNKESKVDRTSNKFKMGGQKSSKRGGNGRSYPSQ